MNTPRDTDAILAAWLEDGPAVLPDQTRRAIAVNTRTTRQARHPMWAPWRTPAMNPLARMAVAAVALVVVVGGAVYLLSPTGTSPGGVGGGPPSTTAPSPSPSPTTGPAPSASAARLPFTSTRYGYSLSMPAGWRTIPSTRAWTLTVDRNDWMSPGSDQYRAAGDSLLFTVFAAPIPSGTTGADWIAAYVKPDAKSSPGSCSLVPVDLGGTSVDGHPATFRDEFGQGDCGGTWAFVPVGSRVFVFTVWLPDNHDLLKESLSTVTFQN